MATNKPDIVLADWRFVRARHCVCLPDGSEKVLPPKMLDVLAELARHHPQVVTHEQLIEAVWQGNHYVGGKAVRNTIWQLRQLLAQNPATADAIETVRKGGYRLLLTPRVIDTHAPIVSTSIADNLDTMARHASPSRSPWWWLLLLIPLLILVGWWLQPDVRFDATAHAVFTDSLTRRFPRVSPDGQMLLYRAQDADNQSQFFVLDLNDPSAPPQQITRDHSHKGIATWAPDQSAIYYFADSGAGCFVQKWDRAQQRADTLAQCEDNVFREISVSADGRWLAYLAPLTTAGNRSIHVLDLRDLSAPPQRLSCEPACSATMRDRDVAFSPDGRYLAVSRRVSDRAEHIYLVDRHDNTQRQLTALNEDIRGFRWWPDSQHLLVAHSQDLNAQLSRINIISGQRQSFQITGAEYPDINAHRRTIYFQHTERRSSLHRWVIDAAQQAPEPLRRDRFNYRDSSFHPTENKMVYISTQTGHAELWLANQDGSDAKPLTDLKSVLSFPRWSHDGKRIAFVNSPAHGNGNVLQIIDMTSRKIDTVKSTFLFHRAPNWSADDSALLTATGDLRYSELFRISLNGQTVQQLGTNQARIAYDAGPSGLFYYSSARDGLWQWVDGSAERDRYFDCTATIISAYAWTFFQSKIYFIAHSNHHDVIMRLSPTDQQCETLLQLPAGSIARNSGIDIAASSRQLVFTMTEQLSPEIYSISY